MGQKDQAGSGHLIRQHRRRKGAGKVSILPGLFSSTELLKYGSISSSVSLVFIQKPAWPRQAMTACPL